MDELQAWTQAQEESSNISTCYKQRYYVFPPRLSGSSGSMAMQGNLELYKSNNSLHFKSEIKFKRAVLLVDQRGAVVVRGSAEHNSVYPSRWFRSIT